MLTRLFTILALTGLLLSSPAWAQSFRDLTPQQQAVFRQFDQLIRLNGYVSAAR